MTAVLSAGRLWCALALALALSTASAHTPITTPVNNFTPAEDVELGRGASAVIRDQLPVLTDGCVDVYIETLGRHLVHAIPEQFQQPSFEYEFTVLNIGELTTLSLPGGSVFISRHIIELAETEGGLAALIAHELSHVVLRHATAQVTGNERYQIGAITGGAIGAVVAGRPNGVIERGADFAVSSYFLIYDPEHEQQADLLTAQIMARAGYDAHHELESDALSLIRAQLAAKPTAPRKHTSHAREILGTVGRGVLAPSSGSRIDTAGDLLQLRVPEHWRRLQTGNTAVFAPGGAFLQLPDGPTAVTHGVQVGVARSLTGELEGDMQALLTSFGRGNAFLQWRPPFHRVTIGGRSGFATTVRNVSSATGEPEYVSVSGAHLPDGSFLYIIGVAPQDEAAVYRNAFNRVVESVQILR